MIRLVPGYPIDTAEMRSVYVQALAEAGRQDPRIVSINCDLSRSIGTTDFTSEFPGRSINVGIQESNGMGVAAGLSVAGMIPFFHSFAVFSSRRVFDQAFISCAYAGLNVKIIGADPGVSATSNGGTHMAFEDMGLMRNIPTARVIDISDPVMLRGIVPELVRHYGVDYLRLPRKKEHRIYEAGTPFVIGKANLLREGSDVTILACGLLVHQALLAADQLAAEGIQARVADLFTIKPIDRSFILESAARTGAFVTCENHSIINGLGSAVAEVLVENHPAPLERVGINDEFGEIGDQEYLMRRFGLTADNICARARQAIGRKRA
ncbi:MAG TPA: transketolase [Clostridiales bacterium]|nr:transketolase [Clostridiales bacterium]